MDNANKNKFSRQIGAVGTKTMEKLMDLNILVLGAESAGQECIKCISLLGIRSLVVVDKDVLTNKRKQNLYYVSKDCKTLGENAVKFSKELNSSIIAESWNQINFNNIIKNKINAIIITKISNHNIFNIDAWCHKNKVKLIIGINYELEGYIFSNFIDHTITDKDGEPCVSGFIEDYSIENNVITINIEKLDNNILSNKGKFVSNTDTTNVFNIKGHTLTSISIECSNELKAFLENNYLENNIKFVETKEHIHTTYKTLQDKIKANTTDYTYLSDTSSFPEDHSNYNNFIKRVFSNNSSGEEFRKKQPFTTLSSIIGGIIAHEVIKITGKYTPINQEIYLNYDNIRGINFYKGSVNRNSDFLDRDLIRKMKKLNIFMVGCGALGCEISKNLGMLDMCSNVNSQLCITDMDTIEQSNLNRQFLFRSDNIGNHKSTVVKERLNEYCPQLNIVDFKQEVGKSTENMFNANFWQNCDLVINALDNVEARKYVDSKCVEFAKPLFESGTLGSKCNTQTIIPFKTATYSELTDEEQKSIPMCTIKSFPNKIEHCIEWGMETFHTYISQPIQDLKKLITNPSQLKEEFNLIDNQFNLNQRLDILSKYVEIYNSSLKTSCTNLTEFFSLVVYIFENAFEYPIRDVLYTFPEDLKNETGIPFWSGKKLKPTIPKLSELNNDFAHSIYNIINKSFKMELWQDELYNSFISSYKATNYVSKKINIDEKKDTVEQVVTQTEEITPLKIRERIVSFTSLLMLPESLSSNNLEVNTIQYDKDDDITLEGMSQLSNTRAKIYSIDTVDRLDIKLISGKIIPALSTTTTVISGFVVLEIIKYFNDIHLKKYVPSDININLGNNQYILFDSLSPKTSYNNMFSNAYGMKVKTVPYKFNTWDFIKINTSKECCPNMEELITILKADYQLDVNMLTHGSTIVYNTMNKSNKTIYELFNELNISKCENIILNISAFTETGLPVITPPLIVQN
jgi:ubiquitin-activating enzyme E1